MKALFLSLLIILSVVGSFATNSKNSSNVSGITSPCTYEIGQSIPDKRIVVLNLKVTGDYSEQVKDWLPSLIEDRLLCEGWTLLVRGDSMKNIQDEHNLKNIKPESKLPENELLGATAFIELNARIQVKDIQGLIGYKYFTLGDYARATVDLNGRIVDPATGVLKSSLTVGGSASGLKTALVATIGSDWKIGAGGYNLKGVRETLVGKAADTAAQRLVQKLKLIYSCIPGSNKCFSSTINVNAALPTIIINLQSPNSAVVGDKFLIERGSKPIAVVEIIKISGCKAEARVLSQDCSILPTDTARKNPTEINTN